MKIMIVCLEKDLFVSNAEFKFVSGTNGMNEKDDSFVYDKIL